MTEKVALVTGSTSGIGREIALELGRAGYKVAVNGNEDDQALIDITRKLAEVCNESIFGFKANVSEECQVKDMIDTVIERYGKIDLLVNNAGITIDGLITEMSTKDWNKVIETNLTGTFFCCREILKSMKPNRSGKIINIASVVGQSGNIGQSNYAASKGGLIALTKSLAKEYAKYEILVNAIAPGFINTQMLDKVPEKVLQKFIYQTPLKRLGDPSDVAKLVKFLASDDANFITGQIFNVNGGLYM